MVTPDTFVSGFLGSSLPVSGSHPLNRTLSVYSSSVLGNRSTIVHQTALFVLPLIHRTRLFRHPRFLKSYRRCYRRRAQPIDTVPPIFVDEINPRRSQADDDLDDGEDFSAHRSSSSSVNLSKNFSSAFSGGQGWMRVGRGITPNAFLASLPQDNGPIKSRFSVTKRMLSAL